jgi:hypothetical protein
MVADVTGLSRTTIHAGIKELKGMAEGKVPAPDERGDRLRAAGSGRKRLAIKDSTLMTDLELLVAPATKGHIRTWCEQMGQPMYPEATRLLVMADCGGSISHRARAWKLHLQKLADETRLEISVCHFPPGKA